MADGDIDDLFGPDPDAPPDPDSLENLVIEFEAGTSHGRYELSTKERWTRNSKR